MQKQAKTLIVLLALLFIGVHCDAQKVTQFNSWWYYNGNHTVSDKVSIQTLYAWCRSDFVREWLESNLKIGINYDYNRTIEFGTGYNWIVLFPYGKQPIPEKRTEHRLVEQLSVKQKVLNFALKHTYKLEQRFSTTGMRQRVRYQIAVKYPLIKSKSGQSKLGAKLSNELMLNIGKSNQGHFFGQNRLYCGFDIPFENSITLSPGYMNQYIVKGNGQIENNYTLMMGLTYNFDFRKK